MEHLTPIQKIYLFISHFIKKNDKNINNKCEKIFENDLSLIII